MWWYASSRISLRELKEPFIILVF